MFSRLRIVAIALVCAVFLAPARGQEPLPRKMVQKVYSVADLVVPIGDCDSRLPMPEAMKTAAIHFSPIYEQCEIMCPVPGEEPCCQSGGCCQAKGPSANACPSEEPCCNSGGCCKAPSCCPNGACCPNGTCCPQGGCCAKAETNWSIIAAPECYRPMPTTTPGQSQAELLVTLITNSVCPQCWTANGGQCTVDYFPLGMGLVVCAPPDVQEQVADLLEALRRLQNFEVAFDVQVVVAPANGYLASIDGLYGPGEIGAYAKFLDRERTPEFIKLLQQDRRVHIIQSPKLTVLNGQNATVRCGEEQFFVTHVNTVQFGGQTIFVPVNEPFSLGFKMSVRPAVCGDCVQCDLDAELTELASPNVMLYPVSTLITPVLDGSAQGQPVPFTQYIQQPNIAKRGVSRALSIPNGKTAVLYAGKMTKTDPDAENGPNAPMFDWIYDVVDLFHAPTPTPTYDEHMFVLVTPRVIRADEVESGAAAVQASPTKPECTCPLSCVGVPPISDAEKFTSDLDIPITPSSFTGPAFPPPCSLPPVCRPCAALADEPVCPQVLPPRCEQLAPCAAAACPMPRLATAVPPTVPCPQIQFDVCILSMDSAAWDKPFAEAWSDLSPNVGDFKKIITPEEATRFCRTMKSQQALAVISAPRILALCGQCAQCTIGGQKVCTTGVALSECGDKCVPEFQTKCLPYGTTVTILGDMVSDGLYIQCDCEEAKITGTGKEYRVTVESPGEQPRTETLRRPEAEVQRRHVAASVPDGRCLMFHCGRSADGKDMIVMITPHVCKPVAEFMVMPPPVPYCQPMATAQATPLCAPPPLIPTVWSAPMPMGPAQQAVPDSDSPLAKMMAKYLQACAAGEKEKAAAYAECCLAIDPMCFCK